MAKRKGSVMIPDELLMHKIYLIRGQKVMLDSDLAELYGVETRTFNQAVKRNAERFPKDFMFTLTRKELDSLRSQIVILENGRGKYSKYLPNAFTEQGVAMLSSVLSSETAIRVNIRIIRIFTKMGEVLPTHKDILLQLEKMEHKMAGHDEDIAVIFDYLKQLLQPPAAPRPKIGF
jgi:ORF6N domain